MSAASKNVAACEHGHYPVKRNKRGDCVQCNREKAREWQAANPEQYREQVRKQQLRKLNKEEVLSERPTTGEALAELQRRTLLSEIVRGEKPASAWLSLIVRDCVTWVAQRGAFQLHLKQLRGRDSSVLAVINEAVARLCEPQLPPNCPESLRQRVADQVILGSFFSAPLGSKEQFELVFHALDNARKAYTKDQGRVGGAPLETEEPVKLDTEAQINLGRHTEAGQLFVNEPTEALARAQAEAHELAQIEGEKARPKIEAAENADLAKAVRTWAATLKPKELAAVNLLVFEPGISDIEANRRTKELYGRGVDRERIAELRAELTKTADRWLTISPEELPAPVVDAGRVTDISQLPAAPTSDLEAVDGGTRAMLAYETETLGEAASRYDATSVGGAFGVMEADTADSANSRGGQSQSEALQGGWGHGRRHYDVDQLASGRDGYGGEPARLADQQRFASNFTEAELRALRQQADAADMNVRKLMVELSEAQAKVKEQTEAPAPGQEQLIEGMDPVTQALFYIAAQAQMSIHTFREVLQAADRAEVSPDGLGELLTGLVGFNNRRQAQEQKAQEERRQAESSVRRRRRKNVSKSATVRVKPRRRARRPGDSS
jgi:hypothetical protein